MSTSSVVRFAVLLLVIAGGIRWIGRNPAPPNSSDRTRYKTPDELRDDQITDLRRYDELSAKGFLLSAEQKELDERAERIAARARLLSPPKPKQPPLEITPELQEAERKFREEQRQRDEFERLSGQEIE